MRTIQATFTLLCIISFVTTAPAAVTLKREAPVIEYKTFDRNNPPAEMPHLNEGEAAITESTFRVQAQTHYELVSSKKSDVGMTSVVSVHGVTVTLQLHVIIWLPKDASDKLKAHEEGHRKIAELIYQRRAEKAARSSATSLLVGKRLTGEGVDWKVAAQNAVEPNLRELGHQYMAQTASVSEQMNNTYDSLTAHGTNAKLEEDAIKESTERYEKEHPDTQPAANSKSNKSDKP